MKNYSIENLLEGTSYFPASYSRRHLAGIINFAEKRDDVWVGTDYQAYSIRYRVGQSIKSDWATIAVKVSDL